MSIDTYCYRPWEALLFQSDNSRFFYPNIKLNKQSVGDLCHHTANALKKQEYWITDQLGYRNDTLIKKSDVLLIGDSFIVGTSISQDSILSNALSQRLDAQVYNIAPAGFEDFTALLNQNIISPPKVLIYSFVERRIPSSIDKKNTDTKIKDVSPYDIFKDKVSRFYGLEYAKSRISGERGKGIRGKKRRIRNVLSQR